MSWLTGDPATRLRQVSQTLPAVGAASGAGNSILVSSNDDNKIRRLVGVHSTYQTKFFRIHVRVAGKEIFVFDPQACALAPGYLPLDQLYGVNVQFEYALESPNPGGPAIVANTDEITFRYECVPDV